MRIPRITPDNHINGRIQALKQDNRTWSSSVKQELLYQTGIFDSYVFERLYPARQARNRLVHDGQEVGKDIVLYLHEALVKLLCVCLQSKNIPLEQLSFAIEKPRGMKIEVKENFYDWKELSTEITEEK